MAARPEVSVVVPAYLSHRTIGRCVETLRNQTLQSFELVVVDSSPDGGSERIVLDRFPEARHERSPRRLLPHAALNRGAELAQAPLLAFLSPDQYARPDWLERLYAAHRASGATVAGSMACHGSRWLDRGIHLCKFSRWLPGGAPRPTDMSPSGNMLVARHDFEAAGGFPGELFLGDVELSRRLLSLGRPILFEPSAVVEHHHTQGLAGFLGERFTRGVLYGQMRAGWLGRRRGVLALYLLSALLPVRLIRILALVAADAARAGQLGAFVSTLALIAAGHQAWLAGEALACWRQLSRGRGCAPSGDPVE